MTPQDYLNLARVMTEAGASTDAVLAALRVEGATQADSVRVLRDLAGVRLGAAKEMLEQSVIWSDTHGLNDAVRRAAIDSLGLDD